MTKIVDFAWMFAMTVGMQLDGVSLWWLVPSVAFGMWNYWEGINDGWEVRNDQTPSP